MLPLKPKSGFSESANNKTIPATAKVVKMVRAGSTKSDSGASPLQKSLNSPKSVESKSTVERGSPKLSTTTPDAPKLYESKPTVERRSSKFSSTPTDKQARAPKGSGLQAELRVVQEDVKKAKEQLASTEQEKTRVLEELKDAKKLVDEANEKLKEALAAQRKAQESLEIEKFRADELEQAGIEATQKREEEWCKELESIKNKHYLDSETLLSTIQELERMKNELEAATKVKITALSQAEDAMRIAEVNAEKVELLSAELSHLRSLLDSKLDSKSNDKEEVIKKLGSEVDSLEHELESAKQAEEKLVTMELLVETLRTEMDNAKSAEQDSLKLVEVSKKKAEFLEIQLMKSEQSENSALDSLASVTKQLEENKASLQDSEFDTTSLREKVESLEDQLAKVKLSEKSSLESQSSLAKQLEEVSSSLDDVESEVAVLRGKAESLETEVSDVKKKKLDSDKLADEWKKKAELLEVQLAEANQLKWSLSESLASVTKQLEDSNSSLQNALSEIASLGVRMELLEVELTRYKEELMDSERRLDDAQQDTFEMGKKVDDLKSAIQTLEEQQLWALNNEKIAASDAERFSEERNQLLKELEMAKWEEESAKRAMERLPSALHEMSVEAQETQERLLVKGVEHEDARDQIEQLISALKNTKENYEVMLDEARCEVISLKQDIEKLEAVTKEKEAEWDTKELNFVSAIRESERELVSLQVKMEKVEIGVKDDEGEMVVELREAESRASCAIEAVEEAKAETMRIQERLLDKDNELQSITQDNAEFKMREVASVRRVELSFLLTQATTKRPKENGELPNSGEEFENSKETFVVSVNEDLKLKDENRNGHQCMGEEESVVTKGSEDNQDSEKDEDLSKEMTERESVEDLDSKVECDSFDQANGFSSVTTADGTVSTTKQHRHLKKKKPFLQKFGSLLKKKTPNK